MAKQDIRWFDDWYAIEVIGPGLFAIGEPKYQWLNWNYLIVGRDRALLFDTGPGLRDITPVVASLTDRPVTVLLSHLHFDHSANFHRFDDAALPDLPILRACERDGLLHALEEMYLACDAHTAWVPHAVRQWWPIGHRIDLGGTELEIIATPGHAPESISLHDRRRDVLLAADFLYFGDLMLRHPARRCRSIWRARKPCLTVLPPARSSWPRMAKKAPSMRPKCRCRTFAIWRPACGPFAMMPCRPQARTRTAM
jgi:glyoxylase-like metal-dependent hydrolase (beta-lactamase superfamily II)